MIAVFRPDNEVLLKKKALLGNGRIGCSGYHGVSSPVSSSMRSFIVIRPDGFGFSLVFWRRSVGATLSWRTMTRRVRESPVRIIFVEPELFVGLVSIIEHIGLKWYYFG